MSHHSTDLLPVNLAMALVPFLLSSIGVSVKVLKKLQKRGFAAGIFHCGLSSSVLTKTLDDLLKVIAQILAIGMTVAKCICRFVLPCWNIYTNVSCSHENLHLLST